MSDVHVTRRKEGFRAAIDQFLLERLQSKLEKLGPDDSQREEIIAAYARDTWLLSAAKRVEQIQAVTHSLKPVHPDARGTNLYVDPLSLPSLKELGSHVLGQSFEGDVVGNAAALDVYKLLKLEADGIGLLAALLANDEAARSALHDDPVQAQSLSDAFKGLTQLRAGAPSSHTRAKQMYWLAADDPCVDDNYVLMAPLHATSLVHELHAQIQEDRFGDANKAARQARRERKPHDGVYRDYPGLAAQKLGGTKPQNISQLNSERGGVNYLLASLPPTWSRTKLWQPAHVESVFEKLYIVRPEVRRAIRDLRAFLATEPAPNLQTRQRRDAYIDVVVDEIVTMAGEFLQTFPAGWTRDVERFQKLAREEQLWLDPLRGELPEESEFAREWLLMNWPNEIGRRFANWLNRHLSAQLPVGDVEARQWKKELLADEDGFVQQLRELRRQLDASDRISRQDGDSPTAGRGRMVNALFSSEALLVFPHLRIQNANAISSPLTHGFPSITAFTGLMWALERNLAKAKVPLRLHGVGVICHHHQEQTTQGYVRSFNLTRNPVDKDGSTAAIVEEGRIHLDISLVFSVSEIRTADTVPKLLRGNETDTQKWANTAGDVLAQMRVAGGSLLPSRPAPGRRVRPWLAVLADDPQERDRQFRQWRRQWLPGFALVGRDDLLADRLRRLRERDPQTSLLDAWLHASRFNHEPVPLQDGEPAPADGKQRWADPWRGAGSGWIVPIPVGYAALSPLHEAGSVLNARDAATPLRFVESVYSLGEWISPHRLAHLEQLLWRAETDEALGLYRCRNDYAPDPSQLPVTDETGQEDDDEIYPYS